MFQLLLNFKTLLISQAIRRRTREVADGIYFVGRSYKELALGGGDQTQW